MDNPAGRLRYWIDQLQSWQNHNDAIVVAACSLLGLDQNTVEGRVATMRLGAMLADLCFEVRKEVAQLPKYMHPDLLLSDFPQIEAAVDDFTLARQQPVHGMLSKINPAGHRGLEMLDAYLHTQRPQPWIEDDVRQSLIDHVRRLIDDVTDADDLDRETKDFVLLRLIEVERGLREALLTGTPGIERATDSLIGAMHRRPDMWDRVSSTKWGPRIAKLAGALVLTIGSVGGLPALMPGDQPQPGVTNIVQIHVENSTQIDGVPQAEDDDVVNAELVEEAQTGTPGPAAID